MATKPGTTPQSAPVEAPVEPPVEEGEAELTLADTPLGENGAMIVDPDTKLPVVIPPQSARFNAATYKFHPTERDADGAAKIILTGNLSKTGKSLDHHSFSDRAMRVYSWPGFEAMLAEFIAEEFEAGLEDGTIKLHRARPCNLNFYTVPPKSVQARLKQSEVADDMDIVNDGEGDAL